MSTHKAGFISIVGKPNVGKSTLMNQLVGEKLSIITSKAQTTRHRIMGIVNDEAYQIVYSDTPGVIKPKYELHNSMMDFVKLSMEDADMILFIVDIHEAFDEEDVLEMLQKVNIPIILVLNKVDLGDQEEVMRKIEEWSQRMTLKEVIPVSALHGFNLEKVFDTILDNLPEHPPFFPKDELTDKPQRFFASEILREKIFTNYEKEVPYACEVAIVSFKDEGNLIRISAEIYVERKSQKAIIIGKGGQMLKKIGSEARIDMEAFFGKKVFLEQYVKVEENWRKNQRKLQHFGYKM
ncbi:GTPase Era [Rapidithrix thailandica]|uniref:GTPase Era n=1 Tax=Rapidithrix thailandica TaxID=413964 RepID=A0AAW9S6C0_9BACT